VLLIILLRFKKRGGKLMVIVPDHKELDFENLNSYQGMERKRSNPRLDTLFESRSLFPEFSLDLVLS